MYLLDASSFISDAAFPQTQLSLLATQACLELNPSNSFCSLVQLRPTETLVLTTSAAEEHTWMWEEVVGRPRHSFFFSQHQKPQHNHRASIL